MHVCVRESQNMVYRLCIDIYVWCDISVQIIFTVKIGSWELVLFQNRLHFLKKRSHAQLDLRYATWNFPTQSHEKGDYFHTMDLFGNITFLEKKWNNAGRSSKLNRQLEDCTKTYKLDCKNSYKSVTPKHHKLLYFQTMMGQYSSLRLFRHWQWNTIPNGPYSEGSGIINFDRNEKHAGGFRMNQTVTYWLVIIWQRVSKDTHYAFCQQYFLNIS